MFTSVKPNELEGVSTAWDFLWEPLSEEVQKKAMCFLNEIYIVMP